MFGIPHPLKFEYRVLTLRHDSVVDFVVRFEAQGTLPSLFHAKQALPQKTYDANPELGTEF